MNIYSCNKLKHGYLIKVVGLLASLLIASSSHAMTSFTFKATVNDGSIFDGTTGFGTVSYDEAMLESGYYDFSMAETSSQFDISFTIFDQTFDRNNDIDKFEYDSPSLYVSDFVPSMLSLVISEIDVPDPIIDGGSFGVNYIEITNPQILTISLYNLGEFIASPVGSAWDYDIGVELITTEVPVPAAAWLFLSAMASLSGRSLPRAELGAPWTSGRCQARGRTSAR